MEEWPIWIAVLGLSTGVATLASYVICRTRVGRANDRIARLEEEIAQVRIREEDREKKLSEIFAAVSSLQRTTEERLRNLGQKMDEFLASVGQLQDRKSTRLNSSHVAISYAVFCLKKK